MLFGRRILNARGFVYVYVCTYVRSSTSLSLADILCAAVGMTALWRKIPSNDTEKLRYLLKTDSYTRSFLYTYVHMYMPKFVETSAS